MLDGEDTAGLEAGEGDGTAEDGLETAGDEGWALGGKDTSDEGDEPGGEDGLEEDEREGLEDEDAATGQLCTAPMSR